MEVRDRFATAQAAWRQMLADAGIEHFPFGDLAINRNMVGAGARKYDDGTLEYGTVIVKRDKWNDLKDRYVALQLHPPHRQLNGLQSTLWHFHAREAIIVETPQRPRDTFHIYDGGVSGLVESHPNSVAKWSDNGIERTSLEHYFIDPRAPRTDQDEDNAAFTDQVRKFAATIGSKQMTGDLDFNYNEVQKAMAVLVQDFERTFGHT